MAGRRKFQVAPNDPTLTRDYWLSFSDVEEPTVRNKLVYLAIDAVGTQGPAEFNGMRICERLGVSASLINHYFGGRDGLIAEATATAYKAYVLGLRDAAAAEVDASQALSAWIYAQIHWAQKHPGLAEILNYSSAHKEVSSLIHRDYQQEITSYFEFNIYVLVLLINWIQTSVRPELPASPTDVDRESVDVDTRTASIAGSVAWSALGAAVWVSGQHTPSSETKAANELFETVLKTHVDRVIQSVVLLSA